MKRRYLKKIGILLTAVCLAPMSFVGCGNGTEFTEIYEDFDAKTSDSVGQGGVNGTGSPASAADESGIAPENRENAAAEDLIEVGEMFTDRDASGEYRETECIKIRLDGDTAHCDSQEVTVSGKTITVKTEGVYLLSGILNDGIVIVEADEGAKVQLVLNGVTISNSAGAAVYVKSADKVFLTLAEGAENTLSNGGSYTAIDDNNIDGVIFSKSDLVINGKGSLKVNAQAGHGIVSKDDLKITGGNLIIAAEGHGLSGKDSVRIAGGAVDITSGKDGIHADNDKNAEKGYVYIADGNFTINAGGDGISASGLMQIDGGSFDITAGNGSSNKIVAKNDSGDTVSTKGLKAAGNLVINDGAFALNTQDDALHANGSLTVNGGEYQIATGDDGLHADETTTVAGGNIFISTSYEGIEGKDVVISGGYIDLFATDDGINAAGGRDQSGFGGMFGGDFGKGFGGGGNSSLLISGGTVYVNANGDGLDSNGTLTVTGGIVYVDGPTSSADGALDYDGTGEITGGTVMAFGAVGMAQNFTSASNQGSIFLSTGNQAAGTEVALRDAEGNVLCSHTAKKNFSSVVVSCPGIAQGGIYTLSVGDSDTKITMDSLIYGNGGGMGGFGGHGGMGSFGGGRGNWGDWSGDGQNDQNFGGNGRQDMDGIPNLPDGNMQPDAGNMPDGTQRPDMGDNFQMPRNMREQPGDGNMRDGGKSGAGYKTDGR